MRNDTKILRPRGRPRKFDADTVLANAAGRFRAQGYAGTSLDDLAEATGVNRPSLYAAFGDKRAMYLATIERAHAAIDASFAGLAARKPDAETALKAIFRTAIDGFLAGESGPGGCIVVNVATLEAALDPEVREAVARFIAMQDGWIERLLTEAGHPDPSGGGKLASSIVQSLSVRARSGTPRADLIALAKAATAAILAQG
jgi:TetR/AcrR family transcriptional regulator, copper-responsive repressor